MIKQAYRCFSANFEIVPEQLTLLVGDQGSGKSSLLELLGPQRSKHEHDKKIVDIELTKEAEKNGVRTFYFDTERNNPRVVDLITYTNMDGTSRGIGLAGALQARYQSHGEALQHFTVEPLARAKDSVVFIDEPEAGLSLRNQYKLVQSIRTALSNNCQLFVSTHCLPVISAFDNVYSMEHRRWMSSNDFVILSRTASSV
jgi:predicted ATPase